MDGISRTARREPSGSAEVQIRPVSALLRRIIVGDMRSVVGHQARWVAIGYGLSLLAVPIVSRLATPADVGTWLFVAACVSILVPSSNLRLDIALLSDETEIEVGNTARAGITALLPSAIVGAALVMILIYLGKVHGVSQLEALGGHHLFLVPVTVGVGIFVSGAVQIGGAITTRFRSYGPSVESRAVQLIAMPLFQVVLLGCGLGGVGLIVGDMAGRAASLAYLLAKDSVFCAVAFRSWSARGCSEAFKRRRRFALTASTATFFNSICVQFPVVAVTLIYGTAASGVFGMAWRLVNLPQSIVGASLGQLIVGETAHLVREGRTELLAKTYRMLLIAAISGIAIGGITGSAFGNCARWVLGANWADASRYVAVLVGPAIAQILIAPASPALNVFGGDRAQLLIDTSRLTAYGLVVMAALNSARLSSVVVAVAAIQAAYYLGTAVLLLRMCPRNTNGMRVVT